MCNLVEQELNCELCQHLAQLEGKTDAILALFILCLFGVLAIVIIENYWTYSSKNNKKRKGKDNGK